MNEFIVLITRHRFQDEFTTQIQELFTADTKWNAIFQARIDFPSTYILYGNDLVAHFTGNAWLRTK